jgi:hypothetical protein
MRKWVSFCEISRNFVSRKFSVFAQIFAKIFAKTDIFAKIFAKTKILAKITHFLAQTKYSGYFKKVSTKHQVNIFMYCSILLQNIKKHVIIYGIRHSSENTENPLISRKLSRKFSLFSSIFVVKFSRKTKIYFRESAKTKIFVSTLRKSQAKAHTDWRHFLKVRCENDI